MSDIPEPANFIVTVLITFCLPGFFWGMSVAPWDKGENIEYGLLSALSSAFLGGVLLLIIYGVFPDIFR